MSKGDLEFEHYLYEVYLNDRIEHEIQQMMEYQVRNASNPETPLSTINSNPKVV